MNLLDFVGIVQWSRVPKWDEVAAEVTPSAWNIYIYYESQKTCSHMPSSFIALFSINQDEQCQLGSSWAGKSLKPTVACRVNL